MPAGEPLLIKPRGPGEVLDQAAYLVRSGWGRSLQAVLLGYFPWALAAALPIVPGAIAFSTGRMPPRETVYRHVLWMAIYLFTDFVLVRQFLRGWLFALDGAELRGLQVTNRHAAWHGLKRLPSAALATLFTAGPFGLLLLVMTMLASQDPAWLGIAFIAGPLLLLIGLPLTMFGYLAVAVATLERRGPWASLLRSFRLCGSGFGMLLATILVLMILRVFASLASGAVTNLWVQQAVTILVTGLFVIFDVAVESVLYYTLRSQRENYDLELISQEVELYGAEELEAAQPALDRLKFGVTARLPDGMQR